MKTNTLSINIHKTSFALFNLPKADENLPLEIPLLSFHEFKIKQVSSTKFLGVKIDENITWEQQITLIPIDTQKILAFYLKLKNIF